MTRSAKIGLIVTLSVLTVGGIIGYYIWKSNKDKKDGKKDDKKTDDKNTSDTGTGANLVPDPNDTTKTTTTTISNFEQLRANLGKTAVLNADKTVLITDIKGEKQVDFYKNNRFFITGKKGELVKKGTYLDGGKKLIVDGGKTIESNSVWQNLYNTLI